MTESGCIPIAGANSGKALDEDYGVEVRSKSPIKKEKLVIANIMSRESKMRMHSLHPQIRLHLNLARSTEIGTLQG